MPNLKDIRRRITSVEKTQQITSAMRMVAAAKLRRAQDAIEAARPYADRMRETLAEVAAATPDAQHPLLAVREAVRTIEVVVMVSDRGLCGAFNSAVLKRTDALLAERSDVEISLTLVGRKASDHYRRRRADAIGKRVVGIARVEYRHAAEIATHVAERYESGEVDQVLLVNSEFVSTMTQAPRVTQLLPFTAAEPAPADEPEAGAQRGEAEGGGADKLPYDIEPSPEKLLDTLVPKALEVMIFRALLENQAGEHAARMTAMESATRNTEDLIESLTLQYNRARQAAITRELVEIVSGAEAL